MLTFCPMCGDLASESARARPSCGEPLPDDRLGSQARGELSERQARRFRRQAQLLGVLWIFLAFLLALSSAIPAQSFNVDFGSAAMGAGTPASTYGAAAGQPGAWNNVDTDLLGSFYVSPALQTTSGAPSGVVLVFDALTPFPPFQTFRAFEPYTFGDDEKLLDDCYFNEGPSTLTIRGLAPGSYRLYSYAMAPDSNVYQTGVDVAGSLDPLQAVGGDFSAGFVLGATHAEHRVTVTAGADVVITFTVANQFDLGRFVGKRVGVIGITDPESGTGYETVMVKRIEILADE